MSFLLLICLFSGCGDDEAADVSDADHLVSEGWEEYAAGNYEDAIQRQEEYLENYVQGLRDKFARLETQLSTLQTQNTAVENAIASMQAQTGSGN